MELWKETSKHKKDVLLINLLDNLRFNNFLSELEVFFLMFSKLSRLNAWLVYPTYSYKYYGNNTHATLKAHYTFKKAVEK